MIVAFIASVSLMAGPQMLDPRGRMNSLPFDALSIKSFSVTNHGIIPIFCMKSGLNKCKKVSETFLIKNLNFA